MLTPAEIKAKYPIMEMDDIVGGLWDAHDGDIDPSQLTQALEQHVASGNDEGRAAALNGLGMVTRMQGRPEESLRFYQDSLEIRRRLADRRGEAVALRNIAQVQFDAGRYDDIRGAAD